MEKFGKNSAVGSSAETLWDQGGLYTTPAGDSVTLGISSDDNADTMEITVIGLDENFLEQSEAITLTGTTKAVLTKTWSRVFRLRNESATAIQTSAVIYVYDTTDTVTAGVPQTAAKIHGTLTAAENSSLMALYTIPANKTGYLYGFWMASTTPAAATFEGHVAVRKFGVVYQTWFDIHADSIPHMQHEFKFPIELPAKTDIELRVSASSGSRVASGGFTIELIDPSLTWET